MCIGPPRLGITAATNPSSPRRHNGHDENQCKVFSASCPSCRRGPIRARPVEKRSYQTAAHDSAKRAAGFTPVVDPPLWRSGLWRIDRSRIHRPADQTATRLSSPKSGINPAARISELGTAIQRREPLQSRFGSAVFLGVHVGVRRPKHRSSGSSRSTLSCSVSADRIFDGAVSKELPPVSASLINPLQIRSKDV